MTGAIEGHAERHARGHVRRGWLVWRVMFAGALTLWLLSGLAPFLNVAHADGGTFKRRDLLFTQGRVCFHGP